MDAAKVQHSVHGGIAISTGERGERRVQQTFGWGLPRKCSPLFATLEVSAIAEIAT